MKMITLYHGTRESAVPSILTQGLIAGKEGFVWATESYAFALEFAQNLNYPAPNPEATVIVIRAPKSAFIFERPLTSGKKDTPGTRVARFVGNVKPEWIQRS